MSVVERGAVPPRWEHRDGAACAPLGRYRRRQPERTVLHEVVQDRLEPFLDFSTSNGDAIAWNPYLAGQGTENGYGPRKADGPPGSQIPALLLGHEMAHAAGGPMTKQLHRFPAGDFGNMEEERVIKGPETDAARSLGEDTRDDHGGKYVPAQGPTDRGEANEPK